jgi:hypothetical protein
MAWQLKPNNLLGEGACLGPCSLLKLWLLLTLLISNHNLRFFHQFNHFQLSASPFSSQKIMIICAFLNPNLFLLLLGIDVENSIFK